MALNFNVASSNNNAAASTSSSKSDKPKAAGWLNLYLPLVNEDGTVTREKVGAIAIYADSEHQQALFQALAADASGTWGKMLPNIEVTFVNTSAPKSVKKYTFL